MKKPNPEKIAEITRKVVTKFRCFGGGQAVSGNPISQAVKDHAPSFAAGVDVREVVEFILAEPDDDDPSR